MSITFLDDVKVFENEECGDAMVYFDDWLNANDYRSQRELRATMFNSGCSEEEVDTWMAKLEEEFMEWCEENSVNGSLKQKE